MLFLSNLKHDLIDRGFRNLKMAEWSENIEWIADEWAAYSKWTVLYSHFEKQNAVILKYKTIKYFRLALIFAFAA